MKTEARQNRPNFRKVRGWGKKMVKSHSGIKFNNVRIKTKEYEKVIPNEP